MSKLSIKVEVVVGPPDARTGDPILSARGQARLVIESHLPISDIRYYRTELHRILDKAIDSIPRGEPYV